MCVMPSQTRHIVYRYNRIYADVSACFKLNQSHLICLNGLCSLAWWNIGENLWDKSVEIGLMPCTFFGFFDLQVWCMSNAASTSISKHNHAPQSYRLGRKRLQSQDSNLGNMGWFDRCYIEAAEATHSPVMNSTTFWCTRDTALIDFLYLENTVFISVNSKSSWTPFTRPLVSSYSVCLI